MFWPKIKKNFELNLMVWVVVRAVYVERKVVL